MSVWTAGRGASCQAVLFYHIRRMLKGMITVKKVLKELLGVICGAVSGFLAYLIVYYLVYFIGKVPLLNLIVYYPAGSSWALTVLPSTTSVLIGGTIAAAVAGRPKWYSILTIVVNVLPIVYALLTSQLGLGLLIRRGLFIIPAAALLVSWERE